MAVVAFALTAVADLDRLTDTRGLPGTTRDRVRSSAAPLATFPLLGSRLTGDWQGFRFILGPWSWMLLVYDYDEVADRVSIVTIQDARSAASVTSQRRRLRRRPY